MQIMKQDKLALDRAAVQESIRTKDNDGHLHVGLTPISKASVNGYYGREIPRWQQLGLDANKLYQLYRHPEELEKSVASFNGKPLLVGHDPFISADAHNHEQTVGSVNSPAWNPPYLMAALDVWSGPAIKAIEADERKELSSGYRYRADMSPGVTPEGVRYDGVMRDIDASHVALVPLGRAGKDVAVGDAALRKIEECFTMAKKHTLAGATAFGALMTYLHPKMATDAKVDLSPALAGLTKKNFGSKKAKIATDIKGIMAGKLATDASIEDVAEVLEAIAPMLTDEPDEPPVTSDDDDAALKASLKAKGYSDEEIEKICAKEMPIAAADETDEDKAKRLAAEKGAMDAAIKKATTGMVTQTAMDAAIKVATDAVRKTANDVAEAKEAVTARVGQIKVACDSADDVYRAALDVLKVDTSELPVGAAKAVFHAIPAVAPAKRPLAPAMDAAAIKGFDERYPAAGNIRSL